MLTERGKGETEKHRLIKALMVEFGIEFHASKRELSCNMAAPLFD
jgi:hypothetical protein